MCVAPLDVTVTSIGLVGRYPVHRNLVLRLKVTIDLWVVMCADGRGAIVISIALVDRHLAPCHLVLSLIMIIDVEVVMSVGGLAVIAEITQTNSLTNHPDRLLLPEHPILGKRPPESDIGQPGSVPTVPPAVPVVEGPALDRPSVETTPTDDGSLTDDVVLSDIADTVDADTCSFARVVDVVQPFLTETQTELPSVMMIPSRIMDGSAPHIMVTVRSSEFSVILDSGSEMSVLPLALAANFQPPVQLPDTVHEVRTFGLCLLLFRWIFLSVAFRSATHSTLSTLLYHPS